MLRTRKHAQMRGQSLVEFALVLPVLLLTIIMILDAARLLIAYTSTSGSVRRAARYAVVAGLDSANPTYLDCDAMRGELERSWFIQFDPTIYTSPWTGSDPADVYIGYFNQSGSKLTNPANQRAATWNADWDCLSATPGIIGNGDVLAITMTGRVRLLTPIITPFVQEVPFEFTAQRTIFKEAVLDMP